MRGRAPVRLRGTQVIRPVVPLRPSPPNYNPLDEVMAKIAEIQQLHPQFLQGMKMLQETIKQLGTIKQGDPGMPGSPGRQGAGVRPADVEAAVKKLLPVLKPTPTKEEVAGTILQSDTFNKKIKEAIPPVDPLDPQPIIDAVLKIIEEKNIGGKTEAWMESRFAEIRNHVANKDNWRGGGDTVVAGTGVTITNTVNGNKQINAAGGVGAWKTPTPAPDGTTTVFTITGGAPTDVVADGINMFNGFGYTYAANTLTFDNPPTQWVRYR